MKYNAVLGDKSMIDYLVRMDTFVRRGFAKDEKIISILFDMEKAYEDLEIWDNA